MPVSLRESAKFFRVDVSTIRRWVQIGCPCLALGSVGRGHGTLLDLEAVARWRAAQCVPQLTERAYDHVLELAEVALIHALTRDGLARRTRTTDAQAALSVLIIFERLYRNIMQRPLEKAQLPEQLRHLCANYLDSVERGTEHR